MITGFQNRVVSHELYATTQASKSQCFKSVQLFWLSSKQKRKSTENHTWITFVFDKSLVFLFPFSFLLQICMKVLIFFRLFCGPGFFVRFSFEILRGKLAQGRPQPTPSRILDIWPLYRTYPIRDTMSSLRSLVNMYHLLSTPSAHLPLRTPNVLQYTMYGWPRPAPTRGSPHYFHSQCHNGYLKEKDLLICCTVDPSSTDGFAKIIGKWNRWDIMRDVTEKKPEKFKLRRLGDMGLNPIEVKKQN